MTLINVLAGEDYTEDAIALADFRNFGVYDLAGSIKPDLTDVFPPISVVTQSGQGGGVGGTVLSQWGQPFSFQAIDAISALFMHDHVYNEFVLDSDTKSGTDWVVTMPTKRYYYTPVGLSDVSYQVLYLFQRNFGANGACDDILFDLYDREEAQIPVTVGFSPPRPGQKANTLCWEANVLSFNATNVLGSKNNRNISSSYMNGWGDLQFPLAVGDTGGVAHQLISTNSILTSLFGQSAQAVGNVLRPAGRRVRGAVVRERHAHGSGREAGAVAIRRQLRPQDEEHHQLLDLPTVGCQLTAAFFSTSQSKGRNFGSALFSYAGDPRFVDCFVPRRAA